MFSGVEIMDLMSDLGAYASLLYTAALTGAMKIVYTIVLAFALMASLHGVHTRAFIIMDMQEARGGVNTCSHSKTFSPGISLSTSMINKYVHQHRKSDDVGPRNARSISIRFCGHGEASENLTMRYNAVKLVRNEVRSLLVILCRCCRPGAHRGMFPGTHRWSGYHRQQHAVLREAV